MVIMFCAKSFLPETAIWSGQSQTNTNNPLFSKGILEKSFISIFFLQTFGSSVDEVELIILCLSFHQSALVDLSYLACYFATTCMPEP